MVWLIVPFRICCCCRFRNASEEDAGILPLPDILVERRDDQNRDPRNRLVMIPAPGNPVYLVNLIQLPKKHERLRDSLFYNMYRNNMLFDDVESANAYRKYLLDKKHALTKVAQTRDGQGAGSGSNRSGATVPPPPTIFTRDGFKIAADGLMNPRVGQGKMPDRMFMVR